METVCLLKKTHTPFIKMEPQHLLSTAMSTVQIQQQQHQQQQHVCEESLSIAHIPTSATKIHHDNKDSKNGFIPSCSQQQQQLQEQQQQHHENEHNNLKRAWNFTSSLKNNNHKTFLHTSSEDSSNKVRNDDEPRSPPVKKLCREYSQRFHSGTSSDVYNPLNIYSELDTSVSSEKFSTAMQLKLKDEDEKERTPYPKTPDYDNVMPQDKAGKTKDTEWSQSDYGHRYDSDYQTRFDKQDRVLPVSNDLARTDANKPVGPSETSHSCMTTDSSPATPSSGFIDIEADTPPTSPLNLTATTSTASDGYTVSVTDKTAVVSAGCEDSVENAEKSNTQAITNGVETRLHDSAVSLEGEGSHDDGPHSVQQKMTNSPSKVLSKAHPILDCYKHQTSSNTNETSSKKGSDDSSLDRPEDAGQGDFCVHNLRRLCKNSPPRPQQEALRTNFSIEAILRPDFGSLHICTSPKPESKDTKSCSSPDQSLVTGSESENKKQDKEVKTTAAAATKSNHSAFTAVDLRMGTRSSSLCTPSPSSNSSVLSPSCSAGCPSPTFSSSSSLASAIPSLNNTDPCHQDSGHLASERTDDLSTKGLPASLESNISDHKKLLLLGLYQLQHPHQAGLLGHPFYRGQDEVHREKNVHGSDNGSLSFQKLFNNPSKDLDTFIARHLSFLSPPPTCHPTTFPYIYPPTRSHDQHLHQRHDRLEQAQQKQQHHNPQSHVFPNIGQLIAPPFPEQPHPHLDSLRLLQQSAYSAFLPTHSPPLASPESESHNHNLKKVHTNSILSTNQSHMATRHGVHNSSTTNDSTRTETLSNRNHSAKKLQSSHTKPAGEKTIPNPRAHLSNPLHDIIHQFDPEKLFSRTPLSPLLKLSSSRRGNANVSKRFSSTNDTDGKTKLHGSTPGFDAIPFNQEQHQNSSKHTQNRSDSNSKNSYRCESDQKLSLQENLTAPKQTNSRESAAAAVKTKGDNSSLAEGTAKKAAAASEEKETKGENPLWPAWVFCTRYSDRPSSGPRSRKPKRSKTQDEKRPRTAFTNDQLQRLKKEFEDCRYLTEVRRKSLADQLGLTESQIKIWFQNKRAKIKKSGGSRNPLALQLMEQGLYNHSTIKTSEGEDCD